MQFSHLLYDIIKIIVLVFLKPAKCFICPATLLSDAFVSLFTFFITWAVPSIFFFSVYWLCECHRFWKIKYDATGQETAWSILYAVQKHFVWCVLVCEMGLSGCGLEAVCITKTWSHSYSTSFVVFCGLTSCPDHFFFLNLFILCSMLLDALSNQVHYM